MKSNVVQYEWIFNTLNSEQVQTSFSAEKGTSLYFAKIGSTTRKIGSVYPKPARNYEQIKFTIIRDKNKTLTNLAKEIKTITKNYHKKDQRKWKCVRNIC